MIDTRTKEPTVTIGKTPQGQIAVETPVAKPSNLFTSWGWVYSYLGDPSTRYGALTSVGDQVPMVTKLKMLTDPVIGISVAYIASKLVKAEYVIECEKAEIQKFFEAMYQAIHREFMLQAAMAVPLGCLGLIKKFRFQEPKPTEVGAPPVWTSAATPFILTGFDQTYPVGSYPTFDEHTSEFTGFKYSQGTVDRLYALWLTIGRSRAFGKYSGRGRLEYAYKAWWTGEFSDDQLIVHIQKFVDRAIIMDYPPGKTDEGEEFRDVALAEGDKVRSGATLSLPSTVYSVYDPATGEEKLTALRKWAVRLMENAENVAAFLALADALAARKAMGMFIPLQLYQYVRQSSLGGPTTSDVLGKLAVDLILQDATEIDMHLNQYVFPYVLAVNFGPDAPPVTKRTVGLNEYDRAELFTLLQVLATRMDSEAANMIDPEALARQLGVPTRDAWTVPEPDESPTEPEPSPTEPEKPPAPAAEDDITKGFRLNTPYDPKKNPPIEVLERILRERLVDDDLDEAAKITDEDIARVKRQIARQLPELDDLDLVDLIEGHTTEEGK